EGFAFCSFGFNFSRHCGSNFFELSEKRQHDDDYIGDYRGCCHARFRRDVFVGQSEQTRRYSYYRV
ncbi:MAG: hypothetical protein AVDCRST_MAG74-1331, partial [uncultured Pyrinomonadaceae bacterium]